MWRAALILSLLAACAGPERGPPVEVRAAPADGGVRVWFRRTKRGTAGHAARIEVDGGRVEQLLHSTDMLTVSVLWTNPQGELRCVYPYGGLGRFAADGDVDDGAFDYVFLDARGARVTARVLRGCPMLATLDLHVHLDRDQRPGRLALADGRSRKLARARTRVRLPFPRDERGALVSGDQELVLHTASGNAHTFLVGIDGDGTPTATTGYVGNWQRQLESRRHGGR